MVGFNFDYGILFVAIFITFGLAIFLFALSYFGVVKQSGIEKSSIYECGFDPFEDARNKFDVRFYLVAILLIIFDLEIIFLFPWATALRSIDYFGFWSMFGFLTVLIVGFFYEWRKGALDWK